MWYAFEGGDVWLPDISQIEWMKNHCPFARVANGVVNPFLTGHYQEVRPWGWSNSMAHRLHVQGANQELCPSSSWLERIRVLSARGTSLHVLHTLNFPHSYRQAQQLVCIQMWRRLCIHMAKCFLRLHGRAVDEGFNL